MTWTVAVAADQCVSCRRPIAVGEAILVSELGFVTWKFCRACAAASKMVRHQPQAPRQSPQRDWKTASAGDN